MRRIALNVRPSCGGDLATRWPKPNCTRRHDAATTPSACDPGRPPPALHRQRAARSGDPGRTGDEPSAEVRQGHADGIPPRLARSMQAKEPDAATASRRHEVSVGKVQGS
ncbi:MAG: hypothetical protein U5O69_02665 [Candidatus Competibacteraceae bacterium]|nr:hypothetical protein [Candidatus Competibacteraceae bacterium]